MKQFVSQNIILEVSQRELEMIKVAALYAYVHFNDEAINCIARAEGAKRGYEVLANEYKELHRNAKELLESLPF